MPANWEPWPGNTAATPTVVLLRVGEHTVPQRTVDPPVDDGVEERSDGHVEPAFSLSASRLEGCVNAQSRVATHIHVL
jgi:hypothetical protein